MDAVVQPTVAAIIPVFNEEAAIGRLLGELPREALNEVIVVDGGSRDRTAEIAREAGAQVIVEKRRGYGRACASGAQAARSEILAFLDGDGADDPAALPRLVEMVASGKADLALGARSHREAGALPAHSVLGNKLASALISACWRQLISDLPSFKVIRRDALLALSMSEATYGWTIEMIVKAARRGYRLEEIQLEYRRRFGGESKVSGRLDTSLKAAYAILSTLARHGFGGASGEPLIRQRALVLMAKAPFPGEAKTRLASALGPEAAAHVHEVFLRTSLRAAREACGLVAVMCPDERHATALRDLVSPEVQVWAQERPGLMAGISQAFERAAAAGAAQIVVGETDSPNLPNGHVAATFELLDGAGPRIVLGPCADGGYYLVAATGLTATTAQALFEGETYDSSTICRRTASRARELGLPVELGPEWYDVDTVEDLQRLRADLESAPAGQFAELRDILVSLDQGPHVLGLQSRHATL